MFIKSRKGILIGILFLLMVSTSGIIIATVDTSDKENVIIKKEFLTDEKFEKIEVSKPESFDDLLNNKEFKGIRDSLYIEAKMFVESTFNPKAFNPSSSAAGILQITPIMVRECNQILKRYGNNKRYTLSDRYDPIKAREIYDIVQGYHNPKFDLFAASSLWNGGCLPNKLNGKKLVSIRSYHNKVIKTMRSFYNEMSKS